MLVHICHKQPQGGKRTRADIGDIKPSDILNSIGKNSGVLQAKFAHSIAQKAGLPSITFDQCDVQIGPFNRDDQAWKPSTRTDIQP